MNSPNTPAAKARRLTVGYSNQDTHSPKAKLPIRPIPYVRLCGPWLKDAGFAIGQRIKVEVTEGRLTIVPAD